MIADLIIKNIPELVTVAGAAPKIGDRLGDIGVIENGAVAVSNGKFVAVGSTDEVLGKVFCDNVVSASGCAILPGFVDPHTHIVFGGDRSNEFEMRLKGASYEEIMAAGGGIVSPVKSTRDAGYDNLYNQSAIRLRRMIANGTTTFEIKSGYGLSTNSEMVSLMVAKKLAIDHGVIAKTTFLGAHAFPKDMEREDYVSLVSGEMLDVCRHYADYIDVFCDKGAFTNEETAQIIGCANMPIRLHCDELEDTEGAKLAADFGAVSADHLIRTSDEGFEALSKSGTVCTFLPGTSFSLGKTFARARHAIEKGCIVALATDRNPGSCTVESMQFVIGLACTKLGMTPAEALVASTLNAAYSLRLHQTVGSIEVGKRADFVMLDVPSYRFIPYEMTINHVKKTFIAGKEAKWAN